MILFSDVHLFRDLKEVFRYLVQLSSWLRCKAAFKLIHIHSLKWIRQGRRGNEMCREATI